MQEDRPTFLPRSRLQELLNAIAEAGYRCIGPSVRDGAIVYDTLSSVSGLPHGVRDAQAPGQYRLRSGAGIRCFAWANGPQALKPLLFAPEENLWRVERDEAGRLQFQPTLPDPEPVAVIGVRACDLAALRIHDQHFLHSDYPDPSYARRRERLLLVAVNCTHPAETCFCASTGDGPRVTGPVDIVMTEMDEGFVLEAGSGTGRQLVEALKPGAASKAQLQDVDAQIEAAAAAQQRSLPATNLRDVLFAKLEHERWVEVAERCLACGNCTAVCPTCFCHRSVEHPALDGTTSVHSRHWDSCFTEAHSYLFGRPVRGETRLRYRQWLTHKLGSWHDQYGRSGCVGCGRCISWCPVGIDICEEATALYEAAESG